MSGNNINMDKERNEILRYLSGEMSNPERNAFERKMQQDPFLKDAVEGFREFDADTVRKDLLHLEHKIKQHQKTGSSRRITFYRIAASVAVLAVISTLFFTFFNQKIVQKPGQLMITQSEQKNPEPGPEPMSEKAGSSGEARDKMIPAEVNPPAGSQKKPVQPDAEQVDKTAKINTREYTPPASTHKKAEETPEILPEGKPVELQEVVTIVTPPPKKGTYLGSVTTLEENIDITGVESIPASGENGFIADAENDLITETMSGQKKETLLFSPEAEVKSQIASDSSVMPGIDIKKSSDNTVLASLRDEQNKTSKRTANSSKASGIPENNALPEPEGGYDQFYKYIADHQSDILPFEGNKKMQVIASFNIGPDGRPDSIFIVESPGKAFSDEAQRLIKDGPNWKPAVINGIKTIENVTVTIPFHPTSP